MGKGCGVLLAPAIPGKTLFSLFFLFEDGGAWTILQSSREFIRTCKAVGGLWDIKLASKAVTCCTIVPGHRQSREILVFHIRERFLLKVPTGARPWCTQFTLCA